MKKNVTFYGMAHSGKSTCIGYLYNEMLEKNKDYDFERYIEKLKCTLQDYDDSRDYGYLVDEYIYERVKTRSGKTGTSKQIHYKNINLGELSFTAIDTPGSAHRRHPRQKGMFYGDVGVFCIEIKQLISDDLFFKKDLYATLLSTLLLWNKYHGSTVIAITKMDTCSFSEEAYQLGCEILHQICCDNITIDAIVPISIEVKNRISHNITSKSNKMIWYKGDSLKEILINSLRNHSSNNYRSSVLFYVDRIHEKTAHTGRIWRIKLLQGTIHIGDKITLAPVKIGHVTGFVTGTIKSIRKDFVASEEGELYIEEAKEGSFVGIDLYDIKYKSRKLKKEEFDVFYSTCGFREKQIFHYSETIIFKIGFPLNEKFSPKREMGLLWFGREIPFSIISRTKEKTGIIITARLLNRYVALPLNDSRDYILKDLIIRYDNNGCENPSPYIDAQLIKILGGEDDEYS